MRKSAVLLVGVLGVFIFLGVLMMQSLVIVQRIASVSEAAGQVLVKAANDEDFRPLGDTTHVLAGYTVRTGAGSGVTLNWVDGSRVRLGPDTSVRVRKCNFNTSSKQTTSLFDLDAGRIWVRVLSAMSGKTKFEVRTPTATAGVRGTVFSVSVGGDGNTAVSVYEGEVVVDADGGTATVSPGEEASVEGAGAPVARQDDDATAWEEQQGIIGPRLDLLVPDAITVPADATSVTISGISEPRAQVTIDGTPVELDRNSRFAAEVPIEGDTGGMIIVAATDYREGQTIVPIAIERQ